MRLREMSGLRRGALAIGLMALLAVPSRAADVTADWADVKPPPAPMLTPVTVDPKTTAFLVLDIVKQTCNEQRRPRCLATLPAIHVFLEQARRAGLPVIFTTTADGSAADILAQAAPLSGEPVYAGPIDKYYGTDLEGALKARGIKTVIIVGTSAQGAVIATVGEAVIRGYGVVLALDGVSGEPYSEQYLAWHEMHAPGVTGHVTLTTTDLIKF